MLGQLSTFGEALHFLPNFCHPAVLCVCICICVFSCQMSKQGELLSLYLCFISFHVCEVYNVHSRHIKWRLQLFKAISYDSLATFYLCHLYQPARTKDSDCQLQNYAPVTGPEFYLTRAAQYLSSLYQFNVSANF